MSRHTNTGYRETGGLPLRPPGGAFTSIAGLYEHFADLFLGNDGVHESASGHRVFLFDHHFFHLASVRTERETRLFMPDHKAIIQSTREGFGPYILGHGGSRARNLPSALETIRHPDEVWTGNPKATNSKWTYLKEFDSKPYPFTVTLLTERPLEGGIIVPVSCFQCSRSDVKRWRRAIRIYPKHIQPPEGG